MNKMLVTTLIFMAVFIATNCNIPRHSGSDGIYSDIRVVKRTALLDLSVKLQKKPEYNEELLYYLLECLYDKDHLTREFAADCLFYMTKAKSSVSTYVSYELYNPMPEDTKLYLMELVYLDREHYSFADYYPLLNILLQDTNSEEMIVTGLDCLRYLNNHMGMSIEYALLIVAPYRDSGSVRISETADEIYNLLNSRI